uniref:Uncharacterized protein n=1 Tax=Arundo donax TaxID=35708 RepID=A0A0A9C1M4_ARUDO
MLTCLMVVLSLGQHLFHFLESRFWNAQKISIQFMGRIHLQRSGDERKAIHLPF